MFGLEKRITKFVFICHIYISITKINIISKFILTINNVMYVHVVSDCITNVQQSETIKKGKDQIKQR